MAKVGRIQVGRYFDFVSCLVLSFLSAASLANRSSLSRAVFARTAWPAATYSDVAFAPSVACCAFWVFLNWASASVRSFECLAMVSSSKTLPATRRGIFDRLTGRDKRGAPENGRGHQRRPPRL